MYDKASPEPLDVIASNECGHMTLTAYRFRACFNEIEKLRAVVDELRSMETIERLRAALKGAKIALVRDGNVTAAAEILMRADEQSAPTKHKIDWSTEPNPHGYISGDYKPPVGCDAVGNPIDPDKQRGVI